MNNSWKVLHLSDLHFSRRNYDELYKIIDEQVRPRVEESDVIVFAGDLWEHLVPNNELPFEGVMELLTSLFFNKRLVVLYGTPNHDVAGSLGFLRSLPQAIIVDYPTMVNFGDPSNPSRGEIYFACCPGNTPYAEAIEFFDKVKHKARTIAVAHHHLWGANLSAGILPPTTEVLLPEHFKDFAAAMLGHIHKPQVHAISRKTLRLENLESHSESPTSPCVYTPPLQIIPIAYSGSLIQLTSGELEEKTFFLWEFCTELDPHIGTPACDVTSVQSQIIAESGGLFARRITAYPTFAVPILKEEFDLTTCSLEQCFERVRPFIKGARFFVTVISSPSCWGKTESQTLRLRALELGAVEVQLTLVYSQHIATRMREIALVPEDEKFRMYFASTQRELTPHVLELLQALQGENLLACEIASMEKQLVPGSVCEKLFGEAVIRKKVKRD